MKDPFSVFWRWVGDRINAAYTLGRGSYSETDDEFRRRLREQERRFVEDVEGRYKLSERWRFWLSLLFVPGGSLLAGYAKFFSDFDDPQIQNWLAGIGISAAFIGGGFTALTDRGRGKLAEHALRILDVARDAVDENISLRERLQKSVELDERRRNLIEVQRSMTRAAAVMKVSDSIETVVEAMFDSALQYIVGAIGFEPGEQWVFSYFEKRCDDAGGESMVRVVARRADRENESGMGRKWARGEGFTGASWARECEIVEADVTSDDIARHYNVPPEKRHDRDISQYVSVAAIPINVDDQVCGVLTATSNRVGRFRSAPSDFRSQYVDTVRVIAGAIAMQKAVRRSEM